MSSHAGKTTFFIKNTSNIIPKILPKSVQNTSKMVPKSWFGGVLGPCGWVLEPSGPENPPDVFFCVFKKLRKRKIADRVLQNWAPMQVKLLFSKGLPKTQKTTKNNKTRKLSSHAGKTSFFEFLGCENHVRGSPLGDAFWYNSGVCLCFFLLSFRPCAQNGILWICMRFSAYFWLHFLSFLQQGGSCLFYNLFKQNHDFQGSRASIFQCFFQSFPHSIPDLIFLVFLVILGSPRLPFWSLWAWFSDIKKKSRKRVCDCTRVYATRGGVPLNKITIPADTAFQHQFTPAVPEGTVADLLPNCHMA